MSGLGGSFYGVPHLLKLLERTRCVGVRDATLLLIEPLISNHPGNASEFVRAGGAGLLVRLAATIHCERLGGDAIGQTSNLLEAGAGSYEDDGAKFRVWFRKGEPEKGMLLRCPFTPTSSSLFVSQCFLSCFVAYFCAESKPLLPPFFCSLCVLLNQRRFSLLSFVLCASFFLLSAGMSPRGSLARILLLAPKLKAPPPHFGAESWASLNPKP